MGNWGHLLEGVFSSQRYLSLCHDVVIFERPMILGRHLFTWGLPAAVPVGYWSGTARSGCRSLGRSLLFAPLDCSGTRFSAACTHTTTEPQTPATALQTKVTTPWPQAPQAAATAPAPAAPAPAPAAPAPAPAAPAAAPTPAPQTVARATGALKQPMAPATDLATGATIPAITLAGAQPAAATALQRGSRPAPGRQNGKPWSA